MNGAGWSLVIGINAAIILIGFWKARGTTSSVDWFLAAKGLPWWMVGLSMFATAVDSGDYVAIAGEAYRDGMSYISAWWLGMTCGWMLVAYFVFMPMYRSGMFTNAEYLEYRFGPATRLISVFIQVQYRTNVLANVAYSLYLTFSVVTNLSDGATSAWTDPTWWLVGAIAFGAAAYTASGGLKSVAFTDCLQSVVMVIASVVLWCVVWNAVGGWSGTREKLAAHDPRLPDAMLHVGSQLEAPVYPEKIHDSRVPPWLYVVGWIIILTAYCVVNHSQSMRMLAARSVWDIKMAAVLASAVTMFMMWFNVSLGVMGRAAIPTLTQADRIFPLLIETYLQPLHWSLLAIVVAGLLAGGISTFDSIGSALAAVITRDLYARFINRNAPDRHYLLVSRLATFAVIGLSFFYIPFLGGGMVKLYLQLVGMAVIPLMTVYLVGISTRANRLSGGLGLTIGILIGMSRMFDSLNQDYGWFDASLPFLWTNQWWGYLWSIGGTALAMAIVTLICGKATDAELAGLVTWTAGTDDQDVSASRASLAQTKGTWLEVSLGDVPEKPAHPFGENVVWAWYRRPTIWTLIILAIAALLNLVVFW